MLISTLVQNTASFPHDLFIVHQHGLPFTHQASLQLQARQLSRPWPHFELLHATQHQVVTTSCTRPPRTRSHVSLSDCWSMTSTAHLFSCISAPSVPMQSHAIAVSTPDMHSPTASHHLGISPEIPCQRPILSSSHRRARRHALSPGTRYFGLPQLPAKSHSLA